MRIPIVGGDHKSRSLNINAQETINLIPVLDPTGKYESALIGTPGLVEWYSLGTSKQLRGLHVMDSYLFAVIGNTLYRITTAAAATAMTGTLSTTTGPVYMADDGTDLMIVDPGIEGYVLDGTTLTAIADADFPTPAYLTWQDGYFIIVKSATGEFYISASYDPTDWTATDYATAERDPDNLKAAFSHNGHLWLIGRETTEIWYNSGASDFPFDPIGGAVLPYGTNSPASVASGEGLIFWLDDRKRVIQCIGHSPQIISDDNLVNAIEGYTTVSDAIGFFYTQKKRAFYVLIFPTPKDTWCYDLETQMWHQRRSFPMLGSGRQDRYRANCYAFFNDLHLIGDYQNGKIYKLDFATYADDGNTVIAERVTRAVHQERKRLFFPHFEIEFEAGVGLYTGQGSDPQAMLQWSDDGGHVWSNELWRDIGQIGEYKNRAIWNRLGSARDRRFKLRISDPIKRVILAAFAEIEMGAN